MGPRSHERGNPELRERGGWQTMSFNGAAFSRTRKPDPEICVGDKVTLLQWGRVLTNAETQSIEMRAGTAFHASMGPRSHERGNESDSVWRIWSGSCFNGAAFSRTRKPVVLPKQEVVDISASMGPRSHERGNLPPLHAS